MIQTFADVPTAGLVGAKLLYPDGRLQEVFLVERQRRRPAVAHVVEGRLLPVEAQHVGQPEWIQHEGTHREHFDVTDAKRQQAIGFGAVAIGYPHGTARLLAAKREAIR